MNCPYCKNTMIDTRHFHNCDAIGWSNEAKLQYYIIKTMYKKFECPNTECQTSIFDRIE